MYSINFTVTNQKFCLSLHYNGENSYLFVNDTEIYKFKGKEILVGPICLTGYVYDFSIDYDSVAVNDIKNIHKYLMKKKIV